MNTTMAPSRGSSFEGRMFFVYDCEAVTKEADPPEDAIIYFYPHGASIEDQVTICGQVVGMTNFLFGFVGASPVLFKLKTEKVAIYKSGQYILALGGSLSEPESLLIRQEQTLYNLFAFYHGCIDTVRKMCRDRAAFLSHLSIIWDCYLPFVRHYGDTLPAVFDPLPFLETPKKFSGCFLKASHILQAFQRRHHVLGGCILYSNRVLCTQLDPSITKRLLLLKPNQSHHPAKQVKTDIDLPFGVRILNAFITLDEYQSLSEALSQSPYCQDATQEAQEPNGVTSVLCPDSTSTGQTGPRHDPTFLPASVREKIAGEIKRSTSSSVEYKKVYVTREECDIDSKVTRQESLRRTQSLPPDFTQGNSTTADTTMHSSETTIDSPILNQGSHNTVPLNEKPLVESTSTLQCPMPANTGKQCQQCVEPSVDLENSKAEVNVQNTSCAEGRHVDQPGTSTIQTQGRHVDQPGTSTIQTQGQHVDQPGTSTIQTQGRHVYQHGTSTIQTQGRHVDQHGTSTVQTEDRQFDQPGTLTVQTEDRHVDQPGTSTVQTQGRHVDQHGTSTVQTEDRHVDQPGMSTVEVVGLANGDSKRTIKNEEPRENDKMNDCSNSSWVRDELVGNHNSAKSENGDEDVVFDEESGAMRSVESGSGNDGDLGSGIASASQVLEHSDHHYDDQSQCDGMLIMEGIDIHGLRVTQYDRVHDKGYPRKSSSCSEGCVIYHDDGTAGSEEEFTVQRSNTVSDVDLPGEYSERACHDKKKLMNHVKDDPTIDYGNESTSKTLSVDAIRTSPGVLTNGPVEQDQEESQVVRDSGTVTDAMQINDVRVDEIDTGRKPKQDSELLRSVSVSRVTDETYLPRKSSEQGANSLSSDRPLGSVETERSECLEGCVANLCLTNGKYIYPSVSSDVGNRVLTLSGEQSKTAENTMLTDTFTRNSNEDYDERTSVNCTADNPTTLNGTVDCCEAAKDDNVQRSSVSESDSSDIKGRKISVYVDCREILEEDSTRRDLYQQDLYNPCVAPRESAINTAYASERQGNRTSPMSTAVERESPSEYHDTTEDVVADGAKMNVDYIDQIKTEIYKDFSDFDEVENLQYAAKYSPRNLDVASKKSIEKCFFKDASLVDGNLEDLAKRIGDSNTHVDDKGRSIPESSNLANPCTSCNDTRSSSKACGSNSRITETRGAETDTVPQNFNTSGSDTLSSRHRTIGDSHAAESALSSGHRTISDSHAAESTGGPTLTDLTDSSRDSTRAVVSLSRDGASYSDDDNVAADENVADDDDSGGCGDDGDDNYDYIYTNRIDGMVHINLYVQAHSDIVLILLAEPALHSDDDTIKALWKATLNELGELEFRIQQALGNVPSQGSTEEYSFLVYDGFSRTMKGNQREPVSLVDHVFCDTAKTVHEHFNNSESLRSITLRGQTSAVHGQRSLDQQVYYQKKGSCRAAQGVPSPRDPVFNLERRASKVLHKEHGVNVF